MDNIPILVAEDSEQDYFLLKQACARAGFKNPLYVVQDGESAMAYLRGEGMYADRNRYPFPGLVLLDIKMPGMDGLEVLSAIRKDARLRRLVVIMLSSSSSESDVDSAFDLRANSYLVKPARLEAMTAMAKRLRNYWLTVNHFPDILTSEPG